MNNEPPVQEGTTPITSTSTLRTAAWTTLLPVALAATVLSGTGGAVWAQNGQSRQGTPADSAPADKTHSVLADGYSYGSTGPSTW
jgi:hypothetical protein